MRGLRLLAVVPLCALVGCVSVNLGVPGSPGGPASRTNRNDIRSGPVGVTVSAPEEKTLEGPEAEEAQAKEGEKPVEVASPPEARLAPGHDEQHVVSGVMAAALATASMVTGPAGVSGRFWNTLLTPSELGREIVARAAQLVGIRNLGRVSRAVPNDCSGFARIAYLTAGIDLVAGGFLAGENAVSAIFRRAMESGAVHNDSPRPGDLVFFRETYDRNRDGKQNDGMTHIGVVEHVDSYGTVTFIHRGSKGVARSHFNLSFPDTRQFPGGPVLNDFLRPAKKGIPARLAGQLVAGFASPDVL